MNRSKGETPGIHIFQALHGVDARGAKSRRRTGQEHGGEKEASRADEGQRIKIVDAVRFYQQRFGIYPRTPATLPGYIMPPQLQLYDVRWEFWN